MKLPGAGRTVVERKKAVGYLLSAEHPDGRSKANFFSGFGFRAERWEVFAEALRDHGINGDVTGITTSDHGTGYNVDGALQAPDGRRPRIRTAWIVENGRDTPRLVTAYPLRRRNVGRT